MSLVLLVAGALAKDRGLPGCHPSLLSDIRACWRKNDCCATNSMIESLCYRISSEEGEATGEKVAGEERGCGISLGGKQANKGKEAGIASFGPLPSGQLHFINSSTKCETRQEQASKPRVDLYVPSCWQGKPGCTFTEGKGTQVNIWGFFLLAYTGCVFLSSITVICTCKTGPSAPFSAKLQVQESL